MKKLFTLVALLAFFLGAKAETVVDYECDYTTANSWAHGWLNEEEHLVFEQGVGLHFSSTEAQEQFYSFQYQLHPGIQVDNDALYTITLRIKGTVAQDIHASFSGSGTPGMIPITTDWVDVVLENCVNDPNAQYFASSGSLLIQPGDYVGEFWIASIKITHEEKAPSRPVEWIQLITNGDAETAWPAWSLEKNEEGINVNWRGDRAPEICAWDLTMGTNFGDTGADGSLDGRARPYPATIEEEEGGNGNHVFAVHVDQIEKIDDDASIQWSNQFWIQAPKEMKDGTKVHLKFRYKAQKAAKAATQIHKQHPSDYLHYVGIGDVNFSTDWQTFDQTITFSGAQAGGWSVAFNLCADSSVDAPQEPNIFYFDDLSWEVMKLDEGWFVAAANTVTGIEYDYDNAIEFTPADTGEEGVYTATVGTKGKQDTWVNEVMISTVRGETAAFKGATIKPSGTITGNDPDNWQDYAAGSQTKIKLPAAGVWEISIAPEDNQILFMELEGEAAKEPVDIVTNPEVIVINGVERQPTKDEQPADPDAGIEEGTGNTWDNQFFIVANRVLEGGEETVIEFDYVATKDAKVLTGTHAAPGDYRKNAFGDVDFTTTEQHFKADYTIPSVGWDNSTVLTGMQSIAFDMAVIKEANDYTIKNVKWYLKGDENESGKTTENLINATGTDNFKVKIGANNEIKPYGSESGINTVVNSNKTNSAVIYNLAGQRVSKDYKGIVVTNGKKVVNK